MINVAVRVGDEVHICYSDCGLGLRRFSRTCLPMSSPQLTPECISVFALDCVLLPASLIPNSESGQCGQIESQLSPQWWDLNLFKLGHLYFLWSVIRT